MVEKIKALRVHIDGLSQLTKTLGVENKYILDVAYLPRGYTVAKFVSLFQNTNWGIVDSRNEESAETEEQKEFKKAIKALQIIPVGSKECENAFDCLILAKAWLGKVLAELGEETPYKNDGKRTGVEHIEPAAETKSAAHAVGAQGQLNWINKGRVEQVDWLRQEIEKIFISVLGGIYVEKGTIYREQAMLELNKARFWLGFELQRMKKESANG